MTLGKKERKKANDWLNEWMNVLWIQTALKRNDIIFPLASMIEGWARNYSKFSRSRWLYLRTKVTGLQRKAFLVPWSILLSTFLKRSKIIAHLDLEKCSLIEYPAINTLGSAGMERVNITQNFQPVH